MSRQGGLGRGLGALIPSGPGGDEGGDVYRELPLSLITPNPRQPRESFDEGALYELAQSIRELGVLQPVLVRRAGDERFELIAGERRYRAAGLAELPTIPAIIRQTDDTALLTEALVENLHRSDLNPLEEAAAYRQLLDDLGMTHDQLATRIGRSRSAISNALRLLNLPPVLQHKLVVGSLSAGHARALLSLEHREEMLRAAQRVVGEGMSVRATEDLVRSMLDSGSTEPMADAAARAEAARRRSASPYAHIQRRLTDALSTQVRITGSDNRGRVVINYSGREDLERVLAILGSGTGEDFLRGD